VRENYRSLHDTRGNGTGVYSRPMAYLLKLVAILSLLVLILPVYLSV